ncbi:hypothetical protein DJ013_22050 [Arcticibacterium luteifluviistationis]|uniref:Uncharacterized protein n=1 Tax=Arcticibacterium luteifluviistationis TaxID=1784714 RepID=A0A2Z4GIL8_9BACT|nr:hypothetical protein DJ013_22050 [Arcticibacterium luteifluviistationis]
MKKSKRRKILNEQKMWKGRFQLVRIAVQVAMYIVTFISLLTFFISKGLLNKDFDIREIIPLFCPL